MGDLHFQHHDGDDDGQNAIGECFESRFLHVVEVGGEKIRINRTKKFKMEIEHSLHFDTQFIQINGQTSTVNASPAPEPESPISISMPLRA